MVKHHKPVPPRQHTVEDPEDRFVAGVLSSGDWLRQNARAVTIGAIVIAILVAGSLYWVRYQRTLREAASAQLNTIRQTVSSGNTPLALRDLSTFQETFGDTPAGREARLIQAQLLLSEGRNEDAIDVVRPVADDLRDPLATNAARLVAAAYEQSERWTEAEAEYMRIANQSERAYERNQALADAARVRMQQGDAAGAVELYQRALDAVPVDDPQVPLLRLRLGEAQARAQGPEA